MDTETNVQNQNPLQPIAASSLFPEQGIDIDPIRTETVFSRLPLHILSKNGPRPQINIIKRSVDGKIEEKWDVSYNEKHGPARQLAYDVHTLVIERAIEEAFDEARRNNRAFPKFISLKSLNDVAHRLGAENAETRNTNRIKKALQQNAGILIDCFIKFRGNDGGEYTLQGTFSPYGIFFFGQKLPDGSTANEVLVNLNDPYFQAWSKAPTRPLDYNYKAQLPPTSRRFYELISYAMYGAIKNHQPTARYRYSEYCKRAPQLRYDTFDQVKKQMNKVHKPHRDSGYIVKVHYDQTTDEQGIIDWWMIYNPGPRAYAEYATFSGKKIRPPSAASQQLPAEVSVHRHNRPRQKSLPLEPAVDQAQLEALTSRGVTEAQARKILTGLPADFPVLDTLEWGNHQISLQPKKFTNPPGFYISLLQGRITPPATFETSTAKAARQKAESAQADAILRDRQAAQEAEDAARRQADEQLAALTPEAHQALLEQAKAEIFKQHPFMAKQKDASAIHEGAIRARMRAMITTGWKFELAPAEPTTAQPEQGSTAPLDVQAILTTPQLPPGVEHPPQGSPAPASASKVDDHLL